MVDEQRDLEGKVEEPPDITSSAKTHFSLTTEEAVFLGSIVPLRDKPYYVVIRTVINLGKYSPVDALAKIRALADRGVITPYSSPLNDFFRLTPAAEMALRHYLQER